jgi:hypothetical protein
MPDMLTIKSEALRSGSHRSTVRWGRMPIDGRLKKLVLIMEEGKDTEAILVLKPHKIDCRVKAINSDNLIDKFVQKVMGDKDKGEKK